MTHRKTWRVHTINTETSVDFSLDLVKEEAVDEHIDAGWMDGWMERFTSFCADVQRFLPCERGTNEIPRAI